MAVAHRVVAVSCVPCAAFDLVVDPAETANYHDYDRPLVVPRCSARMEQPVEVAQLLECVMANRRAWTDRVARGLAIISLFCAAVDGQLAAQTPDKSKSIAAFRPVEFKAPPGFTVELAAGPPLVAHPIMACFDDRGRLYVGESAGLNLSAGQLEKDLPNSIRMLEDTNGDGRFDRSTVFADRMTFPMGGTWHEGALYVASPPSIWRLQDTDGDGVADRRETLVNHFGYTGNAASIHGCFSAPDGRLYWCDGYHGHEFRDAQGRVTSKRKGSYIFSCWPDGSDVRIHCGGGMDNPVEVDFTDEGEMLGTVNIFYTRPRVDCLVHWLYGGAYPHREQVLDELQTTGELLGPVHRFGHVTVSGMMRYRSGSLNSNWRDNVFVTFFNSGKVVRLEVDRNGSSFQTVEREFLSSTNQEVHLTDVLEDADGSLLVVDTGGWFYRGCPTSQIAKPDVLGAIYRVRRSSSSRDGDSWGARIKFGELSNGQLARLIDDPRFKVRQRAIQQCVERAETIVPDLKQLLKRDNTRSRRNAVWALTRIVTRVSPAKTDGMAASTQSPPGVAAPAAPGNSKAKPQSPSSKRDVAQLARSVIRSALADREASVRQAACHSLAVEPDPRAVEQLLSMLNSDQPAVRRAVARALGRSGDPQTVPSLLRALGTKVDRSLEHSVVWALIEIGAADALRTGLTAQGSDTRRGAMIALDQMDGEWLAASALSKLLDTDDTQLRSAALNVLCRRAKSPDAKIVAPAVEVAEKQLALYLDSQQDWNAVREPVAQLVATFAGHQRVAAVVGRALNRDQSSAEVRRMLLQAIGRGRALPLDPSWVKPIERELQSGDLSAVEVALHAASAIRTNQFNGQLQKLGGDTELPMLLRISLLAAASGRSTQLSDELFGLLLDMVAAPGTHGHSARAAQMMGSMALTPDQMLLLAPQLASAGPLALRDLIRPFSSGGRPDVATAFLAALENARAFNSLPINEVSDIVKRYPAELRPRANTLLARLKAENDRRLARLDQLLALLKQGQPERGRAAFFAEKSKCAVCHRVADKGARIGPDLTTIGRNRSSRDLLESIVFPSNSIVRQYEPYTVVTTQGKVHAGLIARQTADTVFVQQQVGKPIAVPRTEIEQLVPSTVSLMPKGLDQALTEQQLADVIAWLKTLK